MNFAAAQNAYERKDLNRAAAILRKILKSAPSSFQAAHMLAKIEFEKGNTKSRYPLFKMRPWADTVMRRKPDL
jgi:lipopolysaccharide biosynthesis regulator YciM